MFHSALETLPALQCYSRFQVMLNRKGNSPLEVNKVTDFSMLDRSSSCRGSCKCCVHWCILRAITFSILRVCLAVLSFWVCLFQFLRPFFPPCGLDMIHSSSWGFKQPTGSCPRPVCVNTCVGFFFYILRKTTLCWQPRSVTMNRLSSLSVGQNWWGIIFALEINVRLWFAAQKPQKYQKQNLSFLTLGWGMFSNICHSFFSFLRNFSVLEFGEQSSHDSSIYPSNVCHGLLSVCVFFLFFLCHSFLCVFSVLCCAATFCTCVFEARRVSLGKPGRGPGGLLDLTQVRIILEATVQISTMGGAGGIRKAPLRE